MTEISQTEEQLIKRIIQSAYDQLGDDADTEIIKKIVSASLKEISKMYPKGVQPAANETVNIPMDSTRVIITAFGLNKPGIVARISGNLADNACNILDISQKILQEFFTIIMIVDIGECPKNLKDLKDELGEIGNDIGVRVLIQHEDVFNYQHRI